MYNRGCNNNAIPHDASSTCEQVTALALSSLIAAVIDMHWIPRSEIELLNTVYVASTRMCLSMLCPTPPTKVWDTIGPVLIA